MSAITEFLNELYNGFEEGQSSVGVFVDLNKAFDLIKHDVLLEKLESCGIRGQALEWFGSYLHSRPHYIGINGI